MSTRPYFTLIVRDAKDAPWHIYFGDYDRETVAAEREELRSASCDPIPLNRSRIIKTGSRQVAINAAVAKLNAAVEAVSALAEREPAFTVETVTLPEAWASALINGDISGLDDREIDALDSWDRANPGVHIVDVARDADGEGAEPRFTWSYDLYGGSARGGSVLDYVAHVDREPAAPAPMEARVNAKMKELASSVASLAPKAAERELVAAVAAAGIVSAADRAAELRAAAPAPAEREPAAELVALDDMWRFASHLVEKHGIDGTDTMSDSDHAEWQAAAAKASTVLSERAAELREPAAPAPAPAEFYRFRA